MAPIGPWTLLAASEVGQNTTTDSIHTTYDKWLQLHQFPRCPALRVVFERLAPYRVQSIGIP